MTYHPDTINNEISKDMEKRMIEIYGKPSCPSVKSKTTL